MSLSQQILLSLVLFFLTLHLGSAQPEFEVVSVEILEDGQCDPNNRPTECNITDYNPVCVQAPEGSMTFENPCLACQDVIVGSYVQGACQIRTFPCHFLIAQCANTDDLNNDPNTKNPVCARSPGCNDIQGCYHTRENACAHCEKWYSESFYSGQCQNVKNYCDPHSRPVSCEIDHQPYCAYFRIGCPNNELCSQTVLGDCQACLDPNVIYRSPGKCPQDEDSYFCSIADRIKECTVEDNPVCGSSEISCATPPCAPSRTFENGCLACKDSGIASYIPGKCPEIPFIEEEINEEEIILFVEEEVVLIEEVVGTALEPEFDNFFPPVGPVEPST